MTLTCKRQEKDGWLKISIVINGEYVCDVSFSRNPESRFVRQSIENKVWSHIMTGLEGSDKIDKHEKTNDRILKLFAETPLYYITSGVEIIF